MCGEGMRFKWQHIDVVSHGTTMTTFLSDYRVSYLLPVMHAGRGMK